nr:hydroxyacylglutathione hydrolase [Epibacterium ulvae]
MPLEILTVPCLSDNYAFLLHDDDSGKTALVDAPEAAPILEALSQRNWNLDFVLITHHHWDHIDALPALQEHHNPKIIGATADQHRLPPLDIALQDGDTFECLEETVHVHDVSGHTVGHIAYHFPKSKAVFTADSLMAMGCGRLFEGSAEQMWASLSTLASLPEETMVYSGHEYTKSNTEFALTIEADNPDLHARAKQIAKARENGQPTVPSKLSLERATNPFLRAAEPSIKAALNMTDRSASEVFAEIRKRKDKF